MVCFLITHHINKMIIMKQLQSYQLHPVYKAHNTLIAKENLNPTPMKNFTQNVKIILNFFPYLLKKIYFKQ